MASSSSSAKDRSIAYLFENKQGAFKPKILYNPGYSVQFLAIQINHPLCSNADPNRRYVTLNAKKTDMTGSRNEWKFYFEVEEDLLKSLEQLSPSFHVDGRLKALFQGAHAWDLILSFNGALGPDRRGELLREAPRGGIIEMMMSKDRGFQFTITWSLSISYETRCNLKLGLDSRNCILAKMYSCERTKDLKIVVGNGTEVKCHKQIFAAQSSVLAAMIAPESGMQEAKTARVELMDLSEEGIGYLLPYFYGTQLPISELNCDVAVELFQAAHKYDLTDLETELEKFLLKKGSDWFTPDVMVELYYFVKNVKGFGKLKKHAMKMMTKMREGIKGCQRYKELEQAE